MSYNFFLFNRKKKKIEHMFELIHCWNGLLVGKEKAGMKIGSFMLDVVDLRVTAASLIVWKSLCISMNSL